MQEVDEPLQLLRTHLRAEGRPMLVRLTTIVDDSRTHPCSHLCQPLLLCLLLATLEVDALLPVRLLLLLLFQFPASIENVSTVMQDP